MVEGRARAKTAPLPTQQQIPEQRQYQEQLLESPLEQLEQKGQDPIELAKQQPIPSSLDRKPSAQPQPKSTHPHRDNLPRRTRPKVTPINETTKTRTRVVPPPLPISVVYSQSTIEAELPHTNLHQQERQEADIEEQHLSPDLVPFQLNSKALSLISKAQNKAFKSRPPHILIDNDPGPPDTDHTYERLLSSPTSPQLPHPAMGLTMGIMEAYAKDEHDVGMGQATHARAIVRAGLSYSPALGVRGTPALPSLAFPAHTPTFVSVLPSRPIPSASSNPTTLPKTSTANLPVLPLTPPVSAPLGQNLPRRHRHRRRVPQADETLSGRLGIEKEKREEAEVREVLRFERTQLKNQGGNRVEGNEEENGLFSSLLDFGRARVGGISAEEGRVQKGVNERLPCRAVSADSSQVRGRRRRREGGRCMQVLGKSRVEMGYMRDSEVAGGDCLLVEAVDFGVDCDSANKVGQQSRRLELKLRANVCREGMPSLLNEQIREGCEFMKGWIGRGFDEGKGKIRISVPRWRAQDAFGLAMCFLAWVEEQEHKWIVPLKVNDVVCRESESQSVAQAADMGVYTPIHVLYMRLLDDGSDVDGGAGEQNGKGKGESSERVGLGMVGVGLEEECGQSAHSDSTTGSSRPTVVRKSGGYHTREAALGGFGSSSSSSSSWSTSRDRYEQRRGLRNEWRGVLSYEGLNALVGVWP